MVEVAHRALVDKLSGIQSRLGLEENDSDSAIGMCSGLRRTIKNPPSFIWISRSPNFITKPPFITKQLVFVLVMMPDEIHRPFLPA